MVRSFLWNTLWWCQAKGLSKPVQHFIQHHKNAMLDEMLDWFASLQNFQILKKEEKKCVGWCWMKFDRYQTFHPTFAARSKDVIFRNQSFFMLYIWLYIYVRQLQDVKIRMMIRLNCRLKTLEFVNRKFHFDAFRNQIILQIRTVEQTRKNVLQQWQWRRYSKRKSICSNQRGDLIEKLLKISNVHSRACWFFVVWIQKLIQQHNHHSRSPFVHHFVFKEWMNVWTSECWIKRSNKPRI